MNKLLLVAAGVIALSGCDFAGSSETANASISSLKATGLPATSETDGTAPDVFFEIQNAAGRSYYRSEVMEDFDVANAATATVSGGVEIPTSTLPLFVAVYDYDTSLQESTLMAKSAVFTSDEVEAAGTIALGPIRGEGSTQFEVSR